MGLAAKLAAAEHQQSQNYAGSPPTQYSHPQNMPMQFPSGQQAYLQPVYGGHPQPGYGGYPPVPSGGAQYGQPGPPQAQYYPQQVQPMQLPGLDQMSLKNKLSSIVQQNGLHHLYPEQRLHALAGEILQKDLAGLGRRWRLQPNLILDLVALALYDIVIMADDSGSMRFAENGERIEDLKALLSRIADAATMFDTDGISVRFMNQDLAGNNLRSADDVKAFVAQARFDGLTPLGTMLDRKILRPFVLGPAKSHALRKPVLVIIITDGEPTGEPSDAVRSVIKDAKKSLHSTPYGAGAVAFQFAQVGRDQDATKFLGKLDTDSKIGGIVDVTSYIELEQEEYQRKGIDLTVDLYMVKLLVGAIDSSYDEQDEVKKAKRKSFLGGLFK